MPKIIFILVLFLTSVFTLSCSAQNKSHYPVLILNDKYNQIQKENTKVIPEDYEVNSLQGLILDCSNYDFSLIKTMNNNKLPDFVHVISKAGTFTVKLNAKGKTVIDKSTMQSFDAKNKSFSGFIKGDIVMIGIGTIKNNEMMTYWLGMVDIK